MRLAKAAPSDPDLMEKASALAKRAVANHERAMREMIGQMTREPDEAAPVEVGALIDDVLRFLGSDMAARQITTRISRDGDLRVRARKGPLQRVLLSLITLQIDAAAPGGELRIRLEHVDGATQIMMASTVPVEAAANAGPREIVLESARRVAQTEGGRLSIGAGSGELTLAIPDGP